MLAALQVAMVGLYLSQLIILQAQVQSKGEPLLDWLQLLHQLSEVTQCEDTFCPWKDIQRHFKLVSHPPFHTNPLSIINTITRKVSKRQITGLTGLLVASYPDTFSLMHMGGRAWKHWGIQIIDFQHLKSGGSNQIAEQNHESCRCMTI